MASKDSYGMFSGKKTIGKTTSGQTYLRPSNPKIGVGLDSAFNKLRQPGSLEGKNLSKDNADEIKDVIDNRLQEKSTTSFNRVERQTLTHDLEKKYQEGKLSRNDIKDAQNVIDKINK